MNGAFVSNLLNGNFKATQLTENTLSLKNEISLLHFLPPPSEDNAEYRDWLLNRDRNLHEYAVHSGNISTQTYRSTQLQVDMFLNDQDHTLDEVQSAIANFVTMLSFIYEKDVTKPNKQPLIIYHCMKVLELTHS